MMNIVPGRPDRTLRAVAWAIPVVLAMTALVTWPTIAHVRDAFSSHVDAYFSTWRLMWVARALSTDASTLFDANIFHPATGTLAYSDATLLQGALAAPLLWVGMSPVTVYNLMLLAGFAVSGIGMFVLARHLTGSSGPAFVAAAVFTMAPYRIEHLMHLEMQWAMWIPLALWALTRAVEERSWSFGALSGVFLWFQVTSCVYYGIFLALVTVMFVPLLLLRHRAHLAGAIGPLILGGVIAAGLTAPYAQPYLENSRELGERPVSDILPLSATPLNYLAAPSTNLVWGWTADRLGENERRLFPGFVAIVLSLMAFAGRQRRHVWLYGAVALLSIELSFGLNGWLYSLLFDHLQVLRGLRSPARLAIMAQCGIAVLAALGIRAVQGRFGWEQGRPAAILSMVAVLLIAGESTNASPPLVPVTAPNPSAYDVYRAIRNLGPGVVLELPVPELDALPGRDAEYAFWSAAHWNKLVNGYSGYYPQVYTETLNVMRFFPDRESMARLQRLDVRYIVVHRDFLQPDRYNALLLAMAAEPLLKPFGEFRDPAGGQARLFILESGAESEDARRR